MSLGLPARVAKLRGERWLPPRASLSLLRRHFEPGSAAVAEAMRERLPDAGSTVLLDLAYTGSRDRDGRFDLVLPRGAARAPVIVWVHGGGWFCGSKADVLPYLELLASYGFAGVALNYPRAPQNRHPAAPRAVLSALGHLSDHAGTYGIDPGRLVVAGDSAGAQVAACVALACVEPTYAELLRCAVPIGPAAIRGAALFCGAYDPMSFWDLGGLATTAMVSSMWALSGRRSWIDSEVAETMAITRHVTGAFPATFLRAGDADPFTAGNSAPLAAALLGLGVEVDARIVGEHGAPQGHEYQFALGSPAAEQTLTELVQFLRRVTA